MNPVHGPVACGLVSSLLSSVGKLLDLLRGPPPPPPVTSCPPPRGGRPAVAAELQRLERLLRRIQTTLDGAGGREVRESTGKLWIEELRELAHDAEDALDDYRYELLRRRVQERQIAAAADSSSRKRERDDGEEDGSFSERIKEITRGFEISTDRAGLQLRPEEDGVTVTSEQMGEITWSTEEISTDQGTPQLKPEDEDGGIRGRIEETSRDQATLHLRLKVGEMISGRDAQCRMTGRLLDESLVFGRSEEKEHIIKSLLSCTPGTRIHVLPVVGMGGIGKTTMALMVYNDDRVRKSFDLRGWVQVSESFDLCRLTIAIIESLTRKPCGFKELRYVYDVLKAKVKEKDVFLVLDDLWNEHKSCWLDLLRLLKDAQRVTILVTTRSEVVARLVQSVKPLVLGTLSEDHCWLLFQHYAFGDLNFNEESSLVQVGRKVLKKCGGLPLAVKSIGCLLRSKIDMQTWMEISESEFWEYSDDNEEIFSALRLSFHRLPSRLKPCFLLCALYPKGQLFAKDDMVHLWIACGYIQPPRCKTPEEVASEYFDELNGRSLIETDLDLQNFLEPDMRSLDESSHERKTKASLVQSVLSPQQRFRLHDLTWDLAKSLSSHLLSVTSVDEVNLNMGNKVQHLFLQLHPVRPFPISNSKFISKHGKGNPTIGFNTLGSSGQPDQRFALNPRKLLLQQQQQQEQQVQQQLLRRLLVQGRLPGQLYKVSSLRTLVLKRWMGYNIGTYKFTYLRVLVLDSCKHSGCISAIRNMKHLQYLHATNCDSIGEDLKHLLAESICRLYSLEKLIISTTWHKVSFKYCNLISLRYLHLSVMFIDCSLLHFCELYKLDTLCLENCYNITELDLCKGNLKNLQRLQLSQIRNIKKLNHDSFQCQNNTNKCQSMKATFPALQEIEFDGLHALQNWCGLQDSDCPKLQSITIRNCYKLRRIPYFSSVRKLILSNLALKDLQLSADSAPSQLQILDIRDCQNLNSLMGLKNLCSLGSLYIANCPDLIVSPKMKLPYKPHHVFIDECPGLMEWCGEQDFYYQGFKTVHISYIKRAKECGRGIASFKSFEHLSLDIIPEEGPELILSPDNWLPSELRFLKFDFSSGVPSFHGGLSTVRRLEIRGCPKLETLVGLEKLNLLYNLVIEECPSLYILPEMKFPRRLSTLTIQGCHKLLSFHLDFTYPSSLIELDVSDCKGLMHIGGMGCLKNLESLVLIHCPLLELQELLPVIPESVAVFLCPKLKKWCGIQSIEYLESLPESSCEVNC